MILLCDDDGGNLSGLLCDFVTCFGFVRELVFRNFEMEGEKRVLWD